MNITAVTTAIWTVAYTATAVVGQSVTSNNPTSLITQLGVFAVSIYIAWWFLNRESKNRQQQQEKDAARETEMLERINAAEQKYNVLLEKYIALLEKKE